MAGQAEGLPHVVERAPPRVPQVTTASALPLGLPGVPVPGVDPTEDELAVIQDVTTARAWCGVEDTGLVILERALGGQLRNLRQIVLVDRPGWDFALANMVDDTGNHPGALLVGLLESLRRVARLKCGLCPGDSTEAVRQEEVRVHAEQMADASASRDLNAAQQEKASAAAASAARKIKLSQFLDTTLDAEVLPLAPERFRTM